MYKVLRLVGAILLSVAISLSNVFAASISLGTWQVNGYQMWRTSYPLYADGVINGTSELYYPHSGNYFTASYENTIGKNKSLRIEGGIMGSVNTAAGSDSDWDYATSNNLWYYGEFQARGRSNFINIDVKQRRNSTTEFFYGYSYRLNHYHMTDGIYYITDYTVESPLLRLSNLDSSYTMIYQGPHVGLTVQKPLTPKLTAIGSLNYSPLAIAQGHGWWNLRNLNFNHTGPAQILDATAGLRWAVGKRGAFTIGYRYQWASLFKGWEDLSPDITLEKATNIQQGLYIAGEAKF